MKKIVIHNHPTIICPVDKEPHLLKGCERCDAFKGYHKVLAKDGKVPAAVKCIIDEL